MYEFIKEKEIEKIILEHMINTKTVEDKCRELIKRVYEQTISRVLLQVKLHLESTNQLKALEGLYEDIQTFKVDFEGFLQGHDTKTIDSEYARETLSGMLESLTSLTYDFQDADDENPLIYERMLVISTALLKIKDQINKMEEALLGHFTLPNKLDNDFPKLVNEYLVKILDELEPSLQISIDESFVEVNNFSNRKEVQQYIKFLKNQQGVLSTFIHIDLKIGDDNISDEEAEQLMDEYLKPIILLHDKVSSIIEFASSFDKEYQIIPMAVSNITKIIETNILNDQKLKELTEIVQLDKNNTVDMVITYVNDELTKLSKTEVKRIKKMSAKFELLSCVILEVFELELAKIAKFDLESIEDNTEQRIAKAVVDTLYLKYDALKDKDEDYHIKKKEDYLSFGESFISFKQEFESQCESYLEETLSGTNEGFIKAGERFSRLVDKEVEENLSKDLAYIKNDILFEMTTLEDMIHQSILTLKQSNDSTAQGFAKAVDELYEQLVYQLKRHDILALKPKPRENFNGKIHEVIITDSEEGYTKGQIIRCQNSGYIYENRILKRAAVIVQK